MGIKNVHPFPARMASEIAARHLEGLGDATSGVPLVVDPMCGSGTVLTQAAALGYDAIGVDSDPLAVLMSSVATTRVNVELLRSEAEAVVARARAIPQTPVIWEDEETRAFAKFWFGAAQRTQLARLSSVLASCADGSVRDALGIALSRTIDTKSPKASLASDTSHSRPHRTLRPEENSYDVYQGFLRSVDQIVSFLSTRKLTGNVTVKKGDARHLEGIADASADAVITSPPYLNAIDYLRGHKLSLIWLGYTIAELRAIRSSSIGAERAPSAEVSERARALVSSIERDEENVTAPERLPRRTLSRYASDLVLLGVEMGRIAKPGATIVAVVGNSAIKGNFIRNDLMMRRALEFAKLVVDSSTIRAIPDSARYLPINTVGGDSTIDRRMREEVVLIAHARTR